MTSADHVESGLYRWQGEALARWRDARYRGVIEATTGSGKTRLAIAAIHEVRRKTEHLCVAVIVPTLALADQWREALREGLPARSADIGEFHSATTQATEWRGQDILIIVANSARHNFALIRDRWAKRDPGSAVLLIADECHRLGSAINAQVLEVPVDFSLGLSATAERDDFGDSVFVAPKLGDVIYRYSLQEAQSDRVVANVRGVNLYVRFNDREREEWTRLNYEVARLSGVALHRHETTSRAKLRELARDDASVARLVEVLEQQQALIDSCTSRRACLAQIVDWIEQTDERTIVFHEQIVGAERVFRDLRDRGVAVRLDHSSLKRPERAASLADFRAGRARVLVAVRALDEGINVPDARVAVIAAGSRRRRQRLQRIGRVARLSEGKDSAVVITILALESPEAFIVGRRDEDLIGKGRVTHHRWPETTVQQALSAEGSTADAPSQLAGDCAALIAFLGLEADDSPGFSIPEGHRRADELITRAARAFANRDWPEYRTATAAATWELVELGAHEELWSATIPELPIPESELAGEPSRSVTGNLRKARRALGNSDSRALDRALRYVVAANDEIRGAIDRHEERQVAIAEHELRTLMRGLAGEAETIVRSPPVNYKRLAQIRAEFRDSCMLENRDEEADLQRRLTKVVATACQRLLHRAEHLAAQPSEVSYRKMGALQQTWNQLGGPETKRFGVEASLRLKVAVRTLLLHLVEEAEELVENPRPGGAWCAERIQRDWSAVGRCPDPGLHAALQRRLDDACAAIDKARAPNRLL